jgi:hypothetical protein
MDTTTTACDRTVEACEATGFLGSGLFIVILIGVVVWLAWKHS